MSILATGKEKDNGRIWACHSSFVCAGGSVFIGQFVKNMKYNETKIEHLFNNVRIQQFGRGCFIERSRHKKILTQLMRDWKAANKFSLRESIIWSCSMN